MADLIIGNTEIGNTKATLISKLVQKELAFKPMLVKTITDVSAFAQPGHKTISFPKLSSFTVVNRSEGAYGDASQITSTLDSMNLDFNAYVSWIIDSFTQTQAGIDAQLEAAKLAASAQARYVDTQIISKLAPVAASFVNVGADVNVTYANLVDMQVDLYEADADMTQASIVCSPVQHGALMKLDEFKRADVYGSANIPSGVVGFILGMPVYVHNGLASKELYMYEKSGVAIGFQKGAAYGEESAIGYGVGAKKAAIDQYFGLTGLQLALKGAAAGKSPLVLGLND